MSDNNILRAYTVSRFGIANIQESLESLGFTIKTFQRFPKLAKVELPENYVASLVEADENHLVVDFYDENNIKRGNFYINKKNDVGSTIILRKRMGIHAKKHGVMQEYYFGTPEQKLISLGCVNTEIGSALYIANQAAELQQKLKAAATEVYPDWKSPLAYWELTDEELMAMLPANIENDNIGRVRTNPNVSE